MALSAYSSLTIGLKKELTAAASAGRHGVNETGACLRPVSIGRSKRASIFNRGFRTGGFKIRIMLNENEVYALIGEDGFQRLVAAFYRRVPEDDLLGAMYPRHDFAGAEQRLRDFLVFRFGGPQRYIEQRGHPRLRMRHAPFAIDQSARDRWMSLMMAALEEVALPDEATETLRSFFAATATFMINRP